LTEGVRGWSDKAELGCKRLDQRDQQAGYAIFNIYSYSFPEYDMAVDLQLTLEDNPSESDRIYHSRIIVIQRLAGRFDRKVLGGRSREASYN